MATAAYRITQEALTNVARHADAGRVDVSLECREQDLDPGSLPMTVCGFNLQELTESEGLGVAGMRERAALINGTLEVYSQPEKGTRVYFKVPMDGKSQTDV